MSFIKRIFNKSEIAHVKMLISKQRELIEVRVNTMAILREKLEPSSKILESLYRDIANDKKELTALKVRLQKLL